MEKRAFFVALGVPRGSDAEAIRIAYRKVVTRYRQELEQLAEREEAARAEGRFAVMRTYSERRHAAVMDKPDPSIQDPQREVDRYFGGFVPEVLEAHRARPAGKDLFVEMRLTPESARRGGIFPLHVPVVRPCSVCEDEEHRLACRVCNGTGQLTEDRMVEVTVPPGVRDNEEARIAMEDIGLEATDLIVHVLVSRAPRRR